MQGLKTYAIAACAVIAQVGEFLSGTITLQQALTVIIPALLAATIRHGITTTLNK